MNMLLAITQNKISSTSNLPANENEKVQVNHYYCIIPFHWTFPWCPDTMLLPTPAAARYTAAGHPSPPAPTISMEVFCKASWPGQIATMSPIEQNLTTGINTLHSAILTTTYLAETFRALVTLFNDTDLGSVLSKSVTRARKVGLS